MALDPDPVGVRVQILDPLVSGGDDLRRLDPRVLEPVLALAARLGRDLLGRLVRALEDAGDLLADALERPADRRLR